MPSPAAADTPSAPSAPAFLVSTSDGNVREVIDRLFDRRGVVVATSSLREAAALDLPNRRWAGAFIDLRPKEGAAFALLEALRAADGRLPVVLLAAAPSTEALHRAFRCGVAVVPLPIDASLLDMVTRGHEVQARIRGRIADPRAARALCLRHTAVSELCQAWQERYRLTEAETRILGDLLNGLGRHEIAWKRNISAETMRSHQRHLQDKTRTGTLEAIVWRALHELVFFE